MKAKARDVLELISTDGLVRLAYYLGVRWIGVIPVKWCQHSWFRPRLINKIMLETRRRVLVARLDRGDTRPLGLRKPGV
jgi:hypothetical protein